MNDVPAEATKLNLGSQSLALLAAALVCCQAAPAFPADSIEAVIGDLSRHQGKFVVLVVDVSRSMETDERRARAVGYVERIVVEGLKLDDHVAVYAFDEKPTQVLPETVLRKADDKLIVVDRTPKVSSNVRGSNVRWAHHEALKCAEESSAAPRFVVVLSDGIADPPDPGTEAYEQYLKYYVPDAPEAFPDTAESRDYRRLLSKVQEGDGAIAHYGIWVALGPNGPLAPPPPPTPWWVKALVILGIIVAAAIVVGLVARCIRNRRIAAEEERLAEERAKAPWSIVLKNVTPGGTTAFGEDAPLLLEHGKAVLIGGRGFEMEVPIRALQGVDDPVARIERKRLEARVVALVPEQEAQVWVNSEEVLYAPPAQLPEGAEGEEGPPPAGALLSFNDTLAIQVRKADGVLRRHELVFMTQEEFDRQAAENTTFPE